jgi:hypothetical protein
MDVELINKEFICFRLVEPNEDNANQHLGLVRLIPSRSRLVWIMVQFISKTNPDSSQIFCLFKPGLDWNPMIWIFFKTIGLSNGKNSQP